MTYSLLGWGNGSVPQAAEGFVKATLDSLNAHIAILDGNAVIIHVNKAWRQFAVENSLNDPMHGVGKNYLSICDRAAQYSQDAGMVAQGIRRVKLRQTEEFYMEYPCHSPDENRWFILRVNRFSWYGHDRMVVSHQNVTEMKDAQKELEASKRLLEAILDNLVDGILTFDGDGTIQSLNRAGAYIFGYSAEEMIGRNVRQLIPSLPDQSDRSELNTFLKRFNGLGDELDGQRHDGTVFPMYFSISEVSHDHQKLYIAVVQDFTERKFMETQVREKELLNLQLEKERELRDVKNRFISMMSHDLKTPLAAIRLASSMLRNYGDRSSPEEKQESYDTIDQQVEHLNELISDVITISRQDFTGAELDRQIIDLETYCRDIIEELQLAYRMKRTLKFKGIDRRIEAFIDIKLMRRALTNLLTNAIKYSPDGKPVLMELAYADCQAIIKVKDHGIGIPETDLPRLFEPFNRASNVGSIQGTGLGLAIAKQAVDLHGGSISVQSVVGKGTTFTITLPAEDC